MKTNEEGQHPLLLKEIGYIANWTEWKLRWEKETQTELLQSLLYYGFEVKVETDEEEVDRVCFYLEMADRCFDYHAFETSDDCICYHLGKSRFGKNIESKKDLRQSVSQRAFQVLCQKLFKNTEEGHHYIPSWLRLVVIPQIFSKLLWFFRLNEEGRISNLWRATGFNLETAEKFVREFSFFAWRYSEINFYGRLPDGAEETFQEARVSMLEILFGLKKLDFLLEKERYKTVDEECERKLEELSLSFKLYYLPKYLCAEHKPKTIEEACFAGSQAAEVLILLRKKKQEAARLEQLQEQKERRQDADKKIKELS